MNEDRLRYLNRILEEAKGKKEDEEQKDVDSDAVDIATKDEPIEDEDEANAIEDEAVAEDEVADEGEEPVEDETEVDDEEEVEIPDEPSEDDLLFKETEQIKEDPQILACISDVCLSLQDNNIGESDAICRYEDLLKKLYVAVNKLSKFEEFADIVDYLKQTISMVKEHISDELNHSSENSEAYVTLSNIKPAKD
jgi:hypothetical protein